MLLKRLAIRIALVCLIPLVISCGKSPQEQPAEPSPPPSPPPVVDFALDVLSFCSNHPALRMLGLLKILYTGSQLAYHYDIGSKILALATQNPKVTAIVNTNESESAITFDTPMGRVEFDPQVFAGEHNLAADADETKVAEIDSKIIDDYNVCTNMVLDTGESNFIAQLNMRIDCLAQKGYSSNTLSYVRVKHVLYQ